MKRMTNIFAYATIAFFVAGLFSCSNMQDSGAQAAGVGLAAAKGAYITIGLNESVAKTVLPDIQDAVFTDLVLKGAKSGGAQATLGSWSTASQMQTASVPLELGTWNFTLTAKSGGSSFSATAQKEIVAGQNALLFNLALVDSGTQKGSFSISLSFAAAQNANLVTSAVATLEDMDGNAVSGYSAKNLAINDSAVVFDGSDITAGTYRARIKFFALSNGINFEIASYRELVQVSSGFCSSANRTIESFDELYTITYVLNGGSFASGTSVPETFSRKTTTTLPQSVARGDDVFIGWYTDESCSEDKKITIVENKTKNMTVYAKWKPVYRITYVLNGGTFASGIVAQETFFEDSTVTLPQNVLRDYYNFSGWYTDVACSDDKKITVVENLAKNISVYAKFTPVVYKITYDYNPDNDEENIIQNYTVEDNVSLIVPTASTFYGWHEDADFVGEAITGWNAGERHSDIALYSDCVINFDAETENIVEKIEGMKKIGTITVTGAFTKNLIKAINKALRNLKNVRPKVLVTLDLSNVTGLTELADDAIVSGAFQYYSQLVANESYSSFACCENLAGITLPSTLKKIYIGAFCHCRALKRIIIPGTVEHVGEGAFYGCKSLESVTLEDGVKTIQKEAFSECSALTNISIPNSVFIINEKAFYYDTALKSLYIPENVTKIGAYAFGYCTNLTRVTFQDNISYWYSSPTGYNNGDYCGTMGSPIDNAKLLKNSQYYFLNSKYNPHS